MEQRSVYDIKNLRHKIRPEEEHKYNSPWNIAADFKIDMSFSVTEITGMLQEYEQDHRTGKEIAYNYYEPSINIATMFGFVKNEHGVLTISNRIFETWFYKKIIEAIV